jgi:hypothetical protein
MLTDQGYCLCNLFLARLIGTAQNDGSGVLDLIDKELAKVLDIHLALGRIHNGYGTVHLHIQILCNVLHGLQYVRELANARGFDQNTLRCISVNHFLQGSTEIAYQGATNTTGIHFLNFNAGLLQKAAINANLTELILDQYGLRTVQRFCKKLFNQGRFSSPEETRYHVYLCHFHHPFLLIYPSEPNKSRDSPNHSLLSTNRFGMSTPFTLPNWEIFIKSIDPALPK